MHFSDKKKEKKGIEEAPLKNKEEELLCPFSPTCTLLRSCSEGEKKEKKRKKERLTERRLFSFLSLIMKSGSE